MTSLITPAELATALAGPAAPVVLDVQYNLAGTPGRELYAEAHLPGALFADVDVDLADPPGAGGRHPLPDLDRLQHTLRRWGLELDTPVVVYDQGSGMGSARAWWLLLYVGMSDVRVLDGGLAQWQRDGGPVTQEVPGPPVPGTITLRPGSLPLLDAEGAAALAQRGLLLDARAPERFEGRTEPIDTIAGHIPGAANAPLSEFTDPRGMLKDKEALHAYFAGLGSFEHKQIGAYCGSGITAARLALALRQIGITPAVYVGSWSEWITDPQRRVATGPA